MKSKVFFLALTSLLIGLSGCGHHRDVRPGAEGIHSVTLTAEDAEKGARNALSQAQHFCKQREKDAAIIKESKKYTGQMDEDTYKTTKTAGKVAQAVGGSVWALGNKKSTRRTGALVGLGGTTADIIAGKGYTVEMTFKCI